MRTHRTPLGWKWRWLQWHQALYHWTALHGIEGLPDMLRLDNTRRRMSFSNKCNKKVWVLTNSLLFLLSIHVLAYEHLKRAGVSMNRSFKVVVSPMSMWVIDMYVKCGSMEDAWRVFNKMPSCNVVSWNIMLGGYAMQGHGIEALALFEQMCEEGVEISNITFVYLLSACSHAGLVDEGLCYFESMSMVYKIPATVEHYTCMVDLLGHASYLHEAEDMVKTVPSKADVAVLRALLGACRLQPNLEIGE